MIHVEQHGPVTAIRMARSLIGRPLYWSAAYWVDGLLIDAGPQCTATELVRVLESVHVDQIVVTHAHEDHIGGLAAVQARFPDARVYASARAIPTIQQPDTLRLQLYRRLLWGLPQAVDRVIPFDEVDDVVKTPSYTFRVVETPGHTVDHVCFFEAERRWVFCGDAFIGGDDKAWASEFNMFGIISSLRALAGLRPERLFPGSGSVRRTPQPEIHDKIGRLIRLCREVGKLEAIGLTVPEIVVCLFKEEPRLSFWTRGHFSAANLIEACRAYNAIFAPSDLDDLYFDADESSQPSRPNRSTSSKDSSGNPADRSDLVR